MKCKQAFMHGPFDLRIEEVELPALRKDQVLIKLLACGICQSDVECFEGKSAEGRYDLGPYTPGHEWVGRVTEVGEDVTSIKVGDKVVGDCVLPCHQCANCKDGKMSSACLFATETIVSTCLCSACPSSCFSFSSSAASMGGCCAIIMPDCGGFRTSSPFSGFGMLNFL